MYSSLLLDFKYDLLRLLFLLLYIVLLYDLYKLCFVCMKMMYDIDNVCFFIVCGSIFLRCFEFYKHKVTIINLFFYLFLKIA